MLAITKRVLFVKIRHKRIRRKKGNWDLEVHHGLQEFVHSLKSNTKFCVPLPLCTFSWERVLHWHQALKLCIWPCKDYRLRIQLLLELIDDIPCPVTIPWRDILKGSIHTCMLVPPLPVSQVLGHGAFSAQFYIVLMWKNKKKREVPLGQAVFWRHWIRDNSGELCMWHMFANGGKEGRKAERKDKRCGQSVPYLGKSTED